MDFSHLAPIALGLITGAVLGLTGAGGAIIAVPLLTFGLGLPLVEAAPIGLLAVAMAASLGAYFGFRKGILRYKAAFVMSAFGVLFSPAGLWAGGHIPNQPLTLVFSVVLITVALNLYRQAKRELSGKDTQQGRGQPCMLDHTRGKLTWTLACFRTMVGSGAIAGFLSGLLGVGGGFIIVPALKRFTDLPVNAIISTSLGVITLVSLAGVSMASLSGTVNWNIALPFSAGTLSGMLAARHMGERIRGPRLQQAFALFALSVGISMMLRGVL